MLPVFINIAARRNILFHARLRREDFFNKRWRGLCPSISCRNRAPAHRRAAGRTGGDRIQQTDFSSGSVRRSILAVAAPMMIAQVLNLLYNIVDRIYIGKIPGEGTAALAGLGLCFPVVTLVTAFANLFGVGGAPLCAIARGRGDREGAERIMCNAWFMLAAHGRGADRARHRVPQAHPVPARRERRDLSLCRGLSDGLPAGHGVRDDLARTQSLHQQPGLRPHRHADRAGGRGGEHRARPAVHLCAGHGRARRGGGDCAVPAALRAVGAAVPHRAEGRAAPAFSRVPAGFPLHLPHRGARYLELCHVLYRQSGAGGVQRDPCAPSAGICTSA